MEGNFRRLAIHRSTRAFKHALLLIMISVFFAVISDRNVALRVFCFVVFSAP
jgi:hypothetical protein